MIKKIKNNITNIFNNNKFQNFFITIILSLFLWIFIFNYNDPVIIKNFTVDVNVVNGEIIEKASKSFEIIQGRTVTFRIKGKHSDINNLTVSDISATADLSNLSEINSTSININVNNLSIDDFEIIEQKPELLKVDIDQLISNQYSIEVETTGNLPQDKYLKDVQIFPSVVTLYGADSVISTIKKVVVRPNLTNADEGYNTNCNIVVYNNEDRVISSYKTDINTVKVSADIYTLKEVPININVIDNVPVGYEILGTENSLDYINIAGYSKDLEKLNEIKIDYTLNQISDIENNIDIKDYVDSSKYLISGDSISKFNAYIAPYPTRQFEINKDLVEIKDLSEKIKIEKIEAVNDILEITGPSNKLLDIDEEDIYTYINGEILTIGKNNVSLNVTLDESFNDVQILSLPQYVITVKKK